MNLRALLRQAHLWLGLTLGLLFVVTGVSGSLLAFYPELDAALTPSVRAAASSAQPASWEGLYRTLLEARPDRPIHWRIEVPDAGGPVQARSLSAADMAGEQFAPLIVWVDPRTDTVIRTEQWGRYLWTWLYDLHYHLLTGPTGAVVMGVVGLLVLPLLATGVMVWWPASLRLVRAAFSYRGGALRRQLYDIHKLIGIVAVVVLATIAATGAMINLPEQAAALAAPLSAPYAAPALASDPAPGRTRLPLDAALSVARRELPEGRLKWIDTPGDPSGVYAFRFRQPGEPNVRFPNSVVWVEQYSGRVLGVRDATKDPPATAVIDWLHPLHTGEALGLAGRLLVLLAGLVPLALFVTGLWRWLLPRRQGRADAGPER
jgi:uncharacterized iron-regulated membrane protein